MHKNKETQIKTPGKGKAGVSVRNMCSRIPNEVSLENNIPEHSTQDGKDVFHYVHTLSTGILSYFMYINHLHVYLPRT
jgi:hypothetical protein